ncbi:AMP-binding protein [Amycolatopsis sp. WQ 127309]|uniref:AMP-binding protein n=1 Tax=Amycolatopsis sp. WQ 127309 TaxID=2932773 RepID=UPI001FF28C66|nr:AMP-binding protein [Amycolatopsis sp. WQ 127309]UOZ07000.1 phenazine antibiotic biosynthesis protein [Amycolatopsis sp. WQ 127309]
MLSLTDPPPDASSSGRADPDEYVRAAMQWHFGPDTGSPYWLARAATLGFDPIQDVKGQGDLRRFPNIADELRDIRALDLIPRGYGSTAPIAAVYESGGTTGPPKRIVFLDDWLELLLDHRARSLAEWNCPRDAAWLTVTPSGPHLIGSIVAREARKSGGVAFSVDLDPRWVKKLISAGKREEAAAYIDHLADQAASILRGEDIRVLMTTPPMLERLAQDDELRSLINEKVEVIMWGGAHMPSETRAVLKSESYPGIPIIGVYGSTTLLGGVNERPGGGVGDPCVFDPFSPYMTFSVVDPVTREPVRYGERGQVVMNHVSKAMFLPNNLERDTAIRLRPSEGAMGDAVADIEPLKTFSDIKVVEGVY